ncbi:MAG: sortase [Chloroflexi bacterium]|nr:sortase [Chloroflexota bacterium]
MSHTLLPSIRHPLSAIRYLPIAIFIAACAAAPTREPHRVGGAVPLSTALAESGGVPSAPAAAPIATLPALLPETAPTLPPERVVVASIGLDAPVAPTNWTPGGEWIVPNGSAGWLENSAYPGQPGNTVLAGHHNTQGEVFRRISEIPIGEHIVLNTQGQALDFQVVERLILPDWGISPEQERAYSTYIERTRDTRLTLVTCWPYYTNSHRVIIIAKPAGS